MKLIIVAPKRGRIIKKRLNSASLYFKLRFKCLYFEQFKGEPFENTVFLTIATIKNAIKIAFTKIAKPILLVCHRYQQSQRHCLVHHPLHPRVALYQPF
ncbi:MAG: hypothetical protein ACI8Z9_002414 [Paraglaciecola sp.]|jgi:hypothetical protein